MAVPAPTGMDTCLLEGRKMDGQEASGLNSVRVSFQGNGQTRQNLIYVLSPDEQSLQVCVLIFLLVSTHCK